jgi:uncharacterized protein with von Willebrand factor type A (vWA) domain
LRYFKSPENYIMPSEYDMDRELAKAGLRSDSDFFHDVIARNAGGGVDETVESEDTSARDFINSFDLSSVPGETPMSRAINLLKTLEQVVAKNETREESGDNGPSNDVLNKKTVSNKGGSFTFDSPIEAADALKKKFEAIKNMSTDEQKVLGTDPVSLIKTELKTEDFLKISRSLLKFDSFSIRPTLKVRPDVNGDETRMRLIRDASEVAKAASSFWALPKNLRNMRLASGQVMVREKVQREDKKMLLYVMIDTSGSMKSGNRRSKAIAVLMNRLTSVARGDGELVLRAYDAKLHKKTIVKNAEEAAAAFKAMSNHPFSGPSTATHACLLQAVSDIKLMVEADPKKFGGVRHDLVVVTDGEDQIDVTLNELDGIKLHAFICDGDNQNLVNLAVKSGGAGVSRF